MILKLKHFIFIITFVVFFQVKSELVTNAVAESGVSSQFTEAPIPNKPQFDESLIQYNQHNQQDETKVPVLAQKKNVVETQSGPIYKTIVSVFFIFIFGAAGIWYLKKKAVGVNHTSTLMQIKILTQYHVGPKKSIAVVRIAGESLLLGITDNNINLIKSLSLLDEDLQEQNLSEQNQNSFGSTMKTQSVSSNSTPPSNTVVKYAGNSADKDEEFSFASLKNIVDSRLKNIRKW